MDFGPVVSVTSFDHVEETVEHANATLYGLNASVWTDNEALGRSIAERVRCGTMTINDAYLAGWTSGRTQGAPESTTAWP